MMANIFEVAALHIDEEEEYRGYEDRRRAARILAAITTSPAPDTMLGTEYLGTIFEVVTHTETSDLYKAAVLDLRGIGTLVMNSSSNATDAAAFRPELFYRHSMAMTAVYCVAYLLVFAVGIVGNFFVIAVVFRSPRMRTVTNFFIVNLAVADILVIVFCLPATLMSNIFVRRLFHWVRTHDPTPEQLENLPCPMACFQEGGASNTTAAGITLRHLCPSLAFITDVYNVRRKNDTRVWRVRYRYKSKNRFVVFERVDHAILNSPPINSRIVKKTNVFPPALMVEYAVDCSCHSS